jgi:8-oxo-dGTP pyrophosphatase MutT (NUDIX family)
MTHPADVPSRAPVVSSEVRLRGRVWDVRTDVVDIGAVRAVRDVVVHPGAVAVVALDGDDRVLLIEQYRHPVGARLLELPAGLLDVAGEEPLRTAQRELAEEAGLHAKAWAHLVDLLLSPGGSTEALRCFVARDLSAVPGGRPVTGEAEEIDLPQVWLSLPEAVDAILGGRIHNATTVAGILAVHEVARRGWVDLADAHQPWPPLA